MGFEPTTYSMGSCHSTTELYPQRGDIVSLSMRDSQEGFAPEGLLRGQAAVEPGLDPDRTGSDAYSQNGSARFVQ